MAHVMLTVQVHLKLGRMNPTKSPDSIRMSPGSLIGVHRFNGEVMLNSLEPFINANRRIAIVAQQF